MDQGGQVDHLDDHRDRYRTLVQHPHRATREGDEGRSELLTLVLQRIAGVFRDLGLETGHLFLQAR